MEIFAIFYLAPVLWCLVAAYVGMRLDFFNLTPALIFVAFIPGINLTLALLTLVIAVLCGALMLFMMFSETKFANWFFTKSLLDRSNKK